MFLTGYDNMHEVSLLLEEKHLENVRLSKGKRLDLRFLLLTYLVVGKLEMLLS